MFQNSEGETTCLQEIFKSTCSGVEVLSTVLPRVKNDGLQKNLEKQLHDLRRIQMTAGRELGAMGEKPKGLNPLESAGRGLAASARSLRDSSADHIAQLVAEEHRLGIRELKQTMEECAPIGENVKRLAIELLQTEQTAQGNLKKYQNQA